MKSGRALKERGPSCSVENSRCRLRVVTRRSTARAAVAHRPHAHAHKRRHRPTSRGRRLSADASGPCRATDSRVSTVMRSGFGYTTTDFASIHSHAAMLISSRVGWAPATAYPEIKRLDVWLTTGPLVVRTRPTFRRRSTHHYRVAPDVVTSQDVRRVRALPQGCEGDECELIEIASEAIMHRIEWRDGYSELFQPPSRTTRGSCLRFPISCCSESRDASRAPRSKDSSSGR